MQFTLEEAAVTQSKADCLVLGIAQAKNLAAASKEADKALKGLIKRLIRNKDFSADKGEIFLIAEPGGFSANRILLVGLGDSDSLDIPTFQNILKPLYKKLIAMEVKHARLELSDWPIKSSELPRWLQIAATCLGNLTYDFDEFKSKKKKTSIKLKKVSIGAYRSSQGKGAEAKNSTKDALYRKHLNIGSAVAKGMALCRDLGNLPPNICNPTYLSKTAQDLAKKFSNLSCKVIDEKQLVKMGAGAFTAVSQGSKTPGKMILLEYTGAAKKERPYALVGKGVTFDSGGISLKPGAGMDEMKYDMCGAASVLGTLLTVATLKLKINLVVAVAAAENMPGGDATRPGDIVTSLSGQTVEILNTDAEGRLVLCDTLTYISRYKPQVVIDVATLTGACIVALGTNSAVLSNHQPLAEQLLDASNTTHDRAWQLPLWDEYKKMLDSPFADMANISSGRGAGTITAACFLSKFTEDYQWAHLDIAGAAWISGKEKNATGRPVPLLSQYLVDQVS